MKVALSTAVLCFGIGTWAGTANGCGIELILALDVSRSVVNAEYDLQIRGLAAAFRDDEVIETIGWVPDGVMATVTQWSGPVSQHQSIGWRALTDARSIRSFAREIDDMDRRFFAAYTAIGEAIDHAGVISATNPKTCDRRVIDVSGDGASNRGRDPRGIAEALAATGVTINALVIEGASPDPVAYYAENVVRGEGSFLETATSFQAYPEAILRKLLRELRPAFATR